MQLRHRFDQSRNVGNVFVFRDLDDQHARQDPELLDRQQQGLGAASAHHGQQRRRAEVDEQASGLFERRPLLQRGRDAGDLEVEQQALDARRGQQGVRGVQRRSAGAADQGFVGVDRTVVQVHDGLEHRGQCPLLEQARQGPDAVTGAVIQQVSAAGNLTHLEPFNMRRMPRRSGPSGRLSTPWRFDRTAQNHRPPPARHVSATVDRRLLQLRANSCPCHETDMCTD